jgi:hypothetical protein
MVEIMMDFDSEDNPTIKTISMLEDYWHDYLHFKERAIMETGKSELQHRRYLRAAFLTLMAYTEGVVNEWWSNILEKEGKSTREINKFVRREPFYAKCDNLMKKALVIPTPNQQLINRAKSLRNQYVHLTGENNAMLFDGLSETSLIETEKAITECLDELSAVLAIDRHPDTQRLGRDLAKALGKMTHQEYSAPKKV